MSGLNALPLLLRVALDVEMYIYNTGKSWQRCFCDKQEAVGSSMGVSEHDRRLR